MAFALFCFFFLDVCSELMLKTLPCESDSIVQRRPAVSAMRTNAEGDKHLMFSHRKHTRGGAAAACGEHKPRVYVHRRRLERERRRSPFSLLPACLLVWRREHAWVAPRAINRRLSRPSAASLIYGAPPIAPGFIWPLSNTCRVRERSAALAAPLCILNNPDGNCPFPKC